MKSLRMQSALSPQAIGVTSLLAALVLVGCSSENTAAPPAAPVDWHAFDVPHGAVAPAPGPTPKERALAEAYATTVSSADLGGLAAHLADDVRFGFPGLPAGRGKEAVVQGHQTLFGAFDKRTLTITRLLRTDSAQSVEWTMSGVQAREWMGSPATNRPATFRGLTLLLTKDDGTISDCQVYFDVAVVKAQLGIGPKELAALPPATMPTGAPEVIEAARSPDEERDVNAARANLDALEKSDEAAYLATMTDDVVVETLERAQPMRGRDDQKVYFKTIHRTIGQIDTIVDNSLGVSKYAVAEYFIAGEQLAAIGWIPTQRDRVIRLQVVDVMEIRDGKVAHVWRYDNPGQIATSP